MNLFIFIFINFELQNEKIITILYINLNNEPNYSKKKKKLLTQQKFSHSKCYGKLDTKNKS